MYGAKSSASAKESERISICSKGGCGGRIGMLAQTLMNLRNLEKLGRALYHLSLSSLHSLNSLNSLINFLPISTQPISCQKVVDATLGKNPDDGLYMAYCSLSGLFVSGSKCCLFTRNSICCQSVANVALIRKMADGTY
jgi:hypothetical protein